MQCVTIVMLMMIVYSRINSEKKWEAKEKKTNEQVNK